MESKYLMRMPTVSVIIPNFNHSVFLEKRIESILNQTYEDFEIIILDDCSTDNSREILERYRLNPKIVHIIFNTVNSGSTFHQWQRGIDLAKGKYIWIAESDDYSEPTFLAEVVMPFNDDENLVVSFCQSLYVSEKGKIIHKTNTELMEEVINGNDFIATKMLAANYIPNASMAVFKKSKIISGFDAYVGMKYCGDWLFWVHLMLQGKVHISGKYLNYYLRHSNNVASGAQKRGLDFIEGNKVFNFICRSMNVTENNRINALKFRIDEYLQLKSGFTDSDVRQEVLDSILRLDPLSKKILNKRSSELRRTKYFKAFKSIIKRA